MPSFEIVGRRLEAANPFAFSMRSVEFAWMLWPAATRALTTPWVSPSTPRAQPIRVRKPS
jgi:hypothetical protein